MFVFFLFHVDPRTSPNLSGTSEDWLLAFMDHMVLELRKLTKLLKKKSWSWISWINLETWNPPNFVHHLQPPTFFPPSVQWLPRFSWQARQVQRLDPVANMQSRIPVKLQAGLVGVERYSSWWHGFGLLHFLLKMGLKVQIRISVKRQTYRRTKINFPQHGLGIVFLYVLL